MYKEYLHNDRLTVGPCGINNPSAPCMENGKCSKGFPKPFQKQTIVDNENSYATYRRRSPADGGRTIQINGRTVDNSWVVPYNPYLSLRYKAHINVEFCISPKAVKYLCKYTLSIYFYLCTLFINLYM